MAYDFDILMDAANDDGIATIAAAAAAIFTNPAAQTSYVNLIILHNGNTSAETVELYRVPDNAGAVGTAGVTNRFFKESLDADATRIIDLGSKPGMILKDENDTIQAVTDTASKVTIQISGGKE